MHKKIYFSFFKSLFVKINVLIVLQTKCFVMWIQLMLNGWIQIAKKLVENATITHPHLQKEYLLLIANGLHGQSRELAQGLVGMELKFLLEQSSMLKMEDKIVLAELRRLNFVTFKIVQLLLIVNGQNGNMALAQKHVEKEWKWFPELKKWSL